MGLVGPVLLAAFVASAGPREEACDRGYQQGLKAAGQGDWGTANKLFEQVSRDCPGFGALLALAKSEMKLKPANLLLARRHFKEALAAAREPGERSLATEGLAGVEEQLGRLRLAGAPVGASVSIDGHPGAPEEGVFFVEPGARQLTIETGECPPQREIVDVVAGAEKQVRVRPCEKPAPGTSAAAPSSSSAGVPGAPSASSPGAGPPPSSSVPGASLPTSAPSRPLLLGPVVLGLGGLVVGVAGGMLWQQAARRYDTAIVVCPGNQCPSEAARQEVNGTRRDILWGQVVLGAGAAALVGAGVWWWLAPPGKPAQAARVAPLLGPGWWGLSLDGKL